MWDLCAKVKKKKKRWKREREREKERKKEREKRKAKRSKWKTGYGIMLREPIAANQKLIEFVTGEK